MIESGVIKYGDAFVESMEAGLGLEQSRQQRVGQEPGDAGVWPDERASGTARVACSPDRVYRDGDEQSGADILFFIDNIFRFTQAGSEVSALLGRMPSAVGYQPTLATEMGAMQERITSTKRVDHVCAAAASLRTTSRPLHRPRRSPTWTPPQCHHGRSLPWASTYGGPPRQHHPNLPPQMWWASTSIRRAREGDPQRYKELKTSSPSSAWTN